MNQMAFLFDMTSCTGCRTCQVACKDKNDMPIGRFLRRCTDHEGGEFPAVYVGTLAMGCNHCDDPACAKVCSQGAIVKEAQFGLVILQEELCNGCKACLSACPYGAPSFNEETGKAQKCDGCIDWLKNGMQPACVASCTTRALKWGTKWQIAETEGAVRDCKVLPDSSTTSPNYYIIPKPDLA